MKPVIGHHAALDTLRSALESGRLHHAWIFSGPPGIGKCLVAREFARVLLDPQAGAGDLGSGGTAVVSPEGEKLSAGNHPDLHVVHKEDSVHARTRSLRDRKQMNVPLDLLRERIIGGHTSDGAMHEAPAYRKSVLGNGKVFIIDESELMDNNGQNSILKTLEEPPRDTWIILVTSRPERLLPTVRSRCDHVRFGPLPDDDMRRWLGENIDGGDDVDWLLDWSEGAPGMALLAKESNLIRCASDLEPVIESLNSGDWQKEFGVVVTEFISARADQVVKQNKKASKDVANKQALSLILRLLGMHVRTRLANTAPGDVESGRRLWELANRIGDAEDQLQRGLNMKHVLETLAAEWSQTCRT
ncbi:MAG: AAA family ATPase [Phycisphaerales bacterium]|nr:AAA family ATPase [Phycisphaerales bacterium]